MLYSISDAIEVLLLPRSFLLSFLSAVSILNAIFIFDEDTMIFGAKGVYKDHVGAQAISVTLAVVWPLTSIAVLWLRDLFSFLDKNGDQKSNFKYQPFLRGLVLFFVFAIFGLTLYFKSLINATAGSKVAYLFAETTMYANLIVVVLTFSGVAGGIEKATSNEQGATPSAALVNQ